MCYETRRRKRYDRGSKFHETLVDFYQTKWHHITENTMLHVQVSNCLHVFFFCTKLPKLMHNGEICMADKPVTHLQGGRDPKIAGRRFLPNISKFLSDHTESQTIRQNLSQIIIMPCSQLPTLKNVSEKS